MGLRRDEPAVYQRYIVLRRLDAAVGFFLEAMKHIDGIAKTQRVDSAKGIALKVFDHFQHACMTVASQWFGVWMPATGLR